jgi:hypothetical protein
LDVDGNQFSGPKHTYTPDQALHHRSLKERSLRKLAHSAAAAKIAVTVSNGPLPKLNRPRL